MLKVSYLIALYNKSEFIIEAVDSILYEQRLNTDFEIEICIVDDGSTDNSFKIIEENYGNSPFFKLSRFPENRGKNAAYNLAFKMSTGQYICIFGADDTIVPGRTKSMLIAAMETGKSIYGGLIAKDHLLNKTLYKQIPKSADFKENVMGNKLSGGCSFLARDHLSDVFPIPENLKFEDWWIAYFLTRDGLALILDTVVTTYRIHDSNDCGTSEISYESKKKDYLRHLPYFQEMRKIARDKSELELIKRSENLRLAFLSDCNYKALLPVHMDQYWLQLFCYLTLGPKLVLFYYSQLKKLRQQQ
ncbi:glycosyltransferase family 2 protein [Pseudomonas mandelii]|uniref:glycosyltransferase family 2 protein n=1 Tax=Pseudomonas mandelii TaxID=75612 RepID=UPI00224A75BB|nr:glycosyltransferase family 2 protein [Pseudomonas mandelii]MCX2897813.1 glycosyltransferase family 2 protein [Pseudomonas mandelii]